MAEAAGELPAKTGATPKSKAKQLDGMRSADTSPFIIFKIPFTILFCYISVLFFFLVFFLTQLMSFHLQWFVQWLEGIWGETAAVK